MFGDDSTKIQWNEEPYSPAAKAARDPIVIGDSIWFSSLNKSHHDKAENGMTEYCTKSKQIIQTIQYPSNVILDEHCCCVYPNKIYLIDGINGEIIAFDPRLKAFKKKQNIPKIGANANAVVFADKICIFHGKQNTKYCIVYNISKDQVIINEYPKPVDAIVGASAFVYQDKIFTLGGYNNTTWTRMDTFRISAAFRGDGFIEWMVKPQWKLPKGLNYFGCLLCLHYVLIFGGAAYGATFQDSIYLLDLNRKESWQKLEHITCPVVSDYLGILTANNVVHLFLRRNKHPDWKNSVMGHYSLPISTIIGTEFSMDNHEERKCSECDELRSKNESLQQLINDLIDEKEISDDKSKRQLLQYENDNTEYRDKYHKSKAMNMKLRKEKDEYIEKYQQSQMKEQILTKQNEEYKQNELRSNNEIKGLQSQLQQLMKHEEVRKQELQQYKAQIQSLNEQNNKLNEEQKEMQMELIEVKQELKIAKRKNIDPSTFRKWSGDEFVDWITSIEQEKFMKYENALRSAFKREGIDGSAIPDIEKNDWTQWGVQSFKDRTNIHKHVQDLRNQNNNDNQIAAAYNVNNEGGNKTEYH